MGGHLGDRQRIRSLPLAHATDRGRFSPAAGAVQVLAPILLSFLLLAVSARAAGILAPAFRYAALPSSPAFPLDRASPLSGGLDDHLDQLSPIFTPEVRHWAPLIRRWSEAYSVPADLVAVVIQIESCGDPRAISPAGALGLLQVMPYHFSPGDDPFDVETNARRGVRYLASGLRLASNDPELALAGYNGGHSVIGLPSSEWTAETRRYVVWGMGILEDVRAGLASSPRLASWLAAGGSRLCRQAAVRLDGVPDSAWPWEGSWTISSAVGARSPEVRTPVEPVPFHSPG